ncbi:hypothetical protein [Carboxylicivirga sp. M1479]|uniref:hypothetical protein n=1 Tax=Carboxylicivirga sp. M1479 TaxID=2594476 RepID=UPI0011774135|nr:hypothetical protein [Carboxylicivirga sp. M1479]TRX70525.1 hypothetical protein FNN09_11140 [Carboxylicivirga sp. M1479]
MRIKWYIWVLIALGVILLPFGGFLLFPLIKMKLSKKPVQTGSDAVRGQRNKNPFNLRVSLNAWRGKITENKQDEEFEEFENYLYGLRAGLINIRTHIGRGKNTLTLLMNTLSPKHENPTNNFIQFICDSSGLGANEVFVFDKETAFKIAVPIVKFESDYKLTQSEFKEVWELL